MDIKAGVKTTEFWLSVAAFLVGVFLLSGVLPSDHWSVKLGGAVAVGLAALGYSFSRGATKGGAGVLLPLALALAFAASGCCLTAKSPGQCYLSKSLKMTEKVDLALLPEVEKRCAAAVDKCGRIPAAQCKAYGTCVQILTGYKTGMNAAGRSLEAVNKILEDLKTLEAK